MASALLYDSWRKFNVYKVFFFFTTLLLYQKRKQLKVKKNKVKKLKVKKTGKFCSNSKSPIQRIFPANSKSTTQGILSSNSKFPVQGKTWKKKVPSTGNIKDSYTTKKWKNESPRYMKKHWKNQSPQYRKNMKKSVSCTEVVREGSWQKKRLVYII